MLSSIAITIRNGLVALMAGRGWAQMAGRDSRAAELAIGARGRVMDASGFMPLTVFGDRQVTGSRTQSAGQAGFHGVLPFPLAARRGMVEASFVTMSARTEPNRSAPLPLAHGAASRATTDILTTAHFARPSTIAISSPASAARQESLVASPELPRAISPVVAAGYLSPVATP
jgi:hypothetical protein